MTYCELCGEETKNDEWREHMISEKHLALEQKLYCGVRNMKYDKTNMKNNLIMIKNGEMNRRNMVQDTIT